MKYGRNHPEPEPVSGNGVDLDSYAVTADGLAAFVAARKRGSEYLTHRLAVARAERFGIAYADARAAVLRDLRRNAVLHRAHTGLADRVLGVGRSGGLPAGGAARLADAPSAVTS